jgi:MoxR-like ATPase
MTPSTIVSTFPHIFAAKRSVFLKGAVGVGKSSVIHALGAKLGVEVRDTIRASQMDPTDIKGFPAPNVVDGTMHWLTPSFLPPMTVKKGNKQVPNDSKGILFLDELTSGSVAVQAACYQLMLDRKVGEYILPEGWAIVAAGNREIDRSIVNKMPAALANRMVHVDFETSVDDFSAWAIENDIGAETIAYLRFRPTMLHSFQPDSKETAFPSPRTWEFADDIQKMPIDKGAKLELLKGTVGEAAAAEYLASQLPSADHIAMDPMKAAVPESPGAQYAVTTMLSVGTKDVSDFRTFMQYMERMSVEFQVVYVRDLLTARAVPIDTTKEYTKWALKHQDVIKGS